MTLVTHLISQVGVFFVYFHGISTNTTFPLALLELDNIKNSIPTEINDSVTLTDRFDKLYSCCMGDMVGSVILVLSIRCEWLFSGTTDYKE